MNTIFSQPCMAGEFSPITKDEACKKEKKKKKKKRNICKIDLFHLKKLYQQLFLQIFSQVFEK